MKRRLLATVAFAASLALGGVAMAQEKTDDKGPPPPKEREYSYFYDIVDHSVVRPTTRALDLPLLLRKITRNPREAANVDAQDQVRLPSTWWQPRVGFRAVTPDQMLKGRGSSTGPAPGKWTVTRAKSQGVSPGFQMKDSRGNRWFIKFDHVEAPELASSVDVIGSYLYWAAGYNVPENFIAFFHPDSLDIDESATYTDKLGKRRKLTREYLDQLLEGVARQRDGRFRVIASLGIKGQPIGPFEYYGRRSDDPEDLIPHEHRRELRGLWTINAWTNHADSRGPNSLDVWVTDGGRSFVRHHLIDFSGILGAGGLRARSPVTGTEYYVDVNVMMRSLLTLGLAPFPWEPGVAPNIVSAGYIEAMTFDPTTWKPDYPNPAFDERTMRDIRWGARIVGAFSDELIRAAVQQGQYSDARAAEYLTQVLIQRRDKIVRRWLGQGANQKISEKTP
jgi:hypothetical protein